MAIVGMYLHIHPHIFIVDQKIRFNEAYCISICSIWKTYNGLIQFTTHMILHPKCKNLPFTKTTQSNFYSILVFFAVNKYYFITLWLFCITLYFTNILITVNLIIHLCVSSTRHTFLERASPLVNEEFIDFLSCSINHWFNLHTGSN